MINKTKNTAHLVLYYLNKWSVALEVDTIVKIPSMRSLLFGAADIVAQTANSNTTRNISRREVTGINERYNKMHQQ